MKRTLAALGVTIAALFVAAPAHADPTPAVCNTVPDLPGECLDDATYNYIIGLQNQSAGYRDAAAVWQQRYTDANSAYMTEHFAFVDYQIAATDRENALNAKIIVLRGKIKDLRAEIKVLI